MPSVAHGWSLVRHVNADNVLTVHTYYNMLGTQSITREPKIKSVSKHFLLHCKHPKLEILRPQALQGSLLHQICIVNQSVLDPYQFQNLSAASAF